MRAVLLAALLACGSSVSPPPPSEVDCTIESNLSLIECNRKRIEENERNVRILQRVHDLMRAVDCINFELDARRSDRDTVLAVESCLQTAGYRR